MNIAATIKNYKAIPGISVKAASVLLFSVLVFLLLYIAGAGIAISGLSAGIVLIAGGVALNSNFARDVMAPVEVDKVPVHERYEWHDEVEEETPEPNKDEQPEEQVEEPQPESSFEVLTEDLRRAGTQPMADDDTLVFRYQGGFFRAVELGNGLLRIIYPRIFSVSVVDQDLLCRLLNRLNSSYAFVKTIVTSVPDNEDLEVFAYTDIFYSREMRGREALLEAVLGIFFEVQRSLAMSMSVSEQLDETTPSETTVETAYKGFSLN